MVSDMEDQPICSSCSQPDNSEINGKGSGSQPPDLETVPEEK